MKRHKPEFPYQPGPYRFWPPKANPLVQLYGQLEVRHRMRRKLGVTQFAVAGDGLERLKELQGQRVVLCSNHPAHEPIILFRLSCLMRTKFYYFAAREVFIKTPLQGFVLQRVGCFSVVRGTNDKQAFRCARDIISANERWLVAFPEGQDYYQADTVQPFQAGVAQIGFWALDQLRSSQPESAKTQLPAVQYVPVAMRYHYLADMLPTIDDVLAQLEAQLGLPVRRGAVHEPYARLVAVADKVISTNEGHYKLKTDPDETVQARLSRLQDQVIRRATAFLNIEPSKPELPLLDRLRSLFNILDRLGASAESSPYEHELTQAEFAIAAELHRDLYRALNFYAVSSTYILERPTVERYMEVLGRLWREVMGKERFWPPQRALLTVGEPVNLSEHYEAYRQDKRGTVTQLTAGLEAAMVEMIKGTQDLQTPLPLDPAP